MAKPAKPKKKVSAAAAPKRIRLPDLMSKVGTEKITEEEIGAYFYARSPEPGDYVPRLAINTSSVDLAGQDRLAREIENDLGYRAVEVVRHANRTAAGAPAPDGTIIAEGDSWFNLPEFGFPINVPPTLVDILALKRPINNIAHWGDTLAQIVNAAEYVPYLKTGNVKYFLFSAGGNDVLGGGRLAEFLYQRESGDNDPKNAPRYINPEFDRALAEVMVLYGVLLENVRKVSSKTVTLIHGYDFCIPVWRGPWIGRALESRGFHPNDNPAISRAVVKEMLTRFNKKLSALAAKAANSKRVVYVPLLNIVQNAWWDELHPDKNAVKKLAKEFDKALK